MPKKSARRKLGHLIAVHGGLCCYCGAAVTRPRRGQQPDRPTDATRDHLRPRSLGGSSDPANLVLSCLSCNTLKGNLCLAAFLVMLWASRDSEGRWADP